VKNPAYIKIDNLSYPVYLGSNPWREINQIILPFLNSDGIYILSDTHTLTYCFPLLEDIMPFLSGQPLFSVTPGERSKDLHSAAKLWTWLMENGAGRNSLLINLGGGVVSDLGGFVAAAYKRGMKYVNIPTSLIGQVDAAIGGKSALNLTGIKNQVGLFYDPLAVFIMPGFLETLPEDHFKSGIAEIIKCAALSGGESWSMLKQKGVPDRDEIFPFISAAIYYKCQIVAEDPFDNSTRQMLNFGHTIGHALESFFNTDDEDVLLHGHAVATGMICEAYLSYKLSGMSLGELDCLSSLVKSNFNLKPIKEKYYDKLIGIVNFDKKRSGQGIGFSLLHGIGKHSPGIVVNITEMIDSFRYYNRVIGL
jgi:3-dehydroquinate synthase